MKRSIRNISALLALIILSSALLAGCSFSEGATGDGTTSADQGDNGYNDGPIEEKDHASLVELDWNSETVKANVTVKNYVDGDTTHFHVSTDVSENGVLKARYIAINTPESTGKVEAYGQKASNFTEEKLSGASSIVVESDDGVWNLDSTGDRHLVWVWYRNSETENYRNLNIEILQNGLAIASSSANNRYGTVCMDAINQARALKLNVYSGQNDPDMYYGDAIPLTIKEIRCNLEAYKDKKVAFEGVITLNYNNGVYIEEYDPETELYYGMYVYYGYALSGEGLDILSVGNRSRIVGTLQYYETGGTYQVSGLTYRSMKPDDPGNIKKISDGNSPAYVETDPERFVFESLSITDADGNVKEMTVSELMMNASVSMNGLRVNNVYVTDDKSSSSYGAMTLYCQYGGVGLSVRTVPFYDSDNKLVGPEAYEGKTINIKGVVDYFNGTYQVKVFSQDQITVQD